MLRLPRLRYLRPPDARAASASVAELGALVTLAAAAGHPALASALPGYAESAGLVSSPPLRNVGTIGGNLCVDTRCNYYDMTYEWRRSVGFCMKKDGDICLVAPGSSRCWAVSSSDTAPVAIALDATADSTIRQPLATSPSISSATAAPAIGKSIEPRRRSFT